MKHYVAYGLEIASAVALPEFMSAMAGEDVVIRWGDGNETPHEDAGSAWLASVTAQEARLWFRGVGTFMVRGGREIVICPAAEVDEARIRLYLVGTVMAVLLYQRGQLVLHASAVEMDGEAVLFMGNPGAGKSSMAAALHTRGHRIITDDVAPVDVAAGVAVVSPGYPQLKLYPPIAGLLGFDVNALSLLHATEEKRGCRVEERFALASRPLGRIYVLAAGPVPAIAPVDARAGLVELVRHSYPVRLGYTGGARHFHQCVQLARELPIVRLEKPVSALALAECVRMVEAHGERAHARIRKDGGELPIRAPLETGCAA